ncbi:hypothetical protein TNCV_4128381 [Trichonephila clavipes]|nr:hypothetical protein TNCV_4128381 [Trichonephila clavipes]
MRYIPFETESITCESPTSFPDPCLARDLNPNPLGYKPRVISTILAGLEKCLSDLDDRPQPLDYQSDRSIDRPSIWCTKYDGVVDISSDGILSQEPMELGPRRRMPGADLRQSEIIGDVKVDP